ncbi:MAG TPA: hypothetical protein VFX31_13555 [Ktedonobacterales bacterium]|nr:hypothetical protein [Ktedonobacterales bacterium]
MAERKRAGARGERRGTLLDSLPRTPVPPRAPVSGSRPGSRSGAYPADPASSSNPSNPSNSSARRRRPSDPRSREDAADARDGFETPGRLTLPSMPRAQAVRERKQRRAPRRQQTERQSWESWDDAGDYASAADDEIITLEAAPADVAPTSAPYDDAFRGYDGAYVERGADGYGYDAGYEGYEEYGSYEGDWGRGPRERDRALARPLTPALPHYNDPDDDLAPPLYAPLPQDSAPDLAAYRPVRAPHRVRLDTRALARTARNPWTIVRAVLALAAMLLALAHAPGSMGELSQPLMNAQAQAGLAPGGATTTLVRPETQLLRPDLYDNYAQFQEWGGAACSAAALSEVLTAYGVRGATIGHEIDELGSYISPNGGLLNRHGFVVVAAKHNLRADQSTSLTYNQLLYLTEQLGMPVIVNVHISYGYYHFFDGGHFLVVVGGDAQGLRIVDSSEYYIHYLPKDVFYQMFTGYTAAIVPGDYHYTLPNN